MEMNYYNILSALFGTVTGAFITGYFTLKATTNEFKNQKNISNENEEKLKKTILQSILDEIESIYERYMKSIGNKIASLEENESLNQYYPISDDFFMFYRANTIEIGKLEDNELRKLIIDTYILAKSLIESLKINNNFLKQYQEAHKNFLEYQKYKENILISSKKQKNLINSHKEVYEINLELSEAQLRTYAKSLQKVHVEFEGNVKQLLRKLHEIGLLQKNKYKETTI